VDRWRRNQSILRTLRSRPELLAEVTFDKKDRKFLQALLRDEAEESIDDAEKRILENILQFK
jgi:tRNA (guanine37-N1)-methyltransferase